MGEFDKCIYHQSLVQGLVSPKGRLSNFLILSYFQLGEVYMMIDEYHQAEEVLLVGLKVGGDSYANKFRILSSLGRLYLRKKQLDEAEKYFILANENTDSVSQKARALFDLAGLYKQSGLVDKAISFSEESYQLRVKSGLYDAATCSHILTAEVLLSINRVDEAIEILKNSLADTYKYKAVAKSKQVYSLLAKTYKEKGAWKDAFMAFSAFEKIQLDLYINQQKEIFKLKNNEIRKQKEVIEEIHEEVQASIQYAERIQKALLPKESEWDKVNKEHFILF
jgi:tetratricopeptide (TPR) repeat protein